MTCHEDGESRGVGVLLVYPRREMGVGGQRQTPAKPSGKRPGTDCIRDWWGPRCGLDGRRKSRLPHQDTIQSVANLYTDYSIPAFD